MADMNIPANDAPAKQAHAITPPTRTDDQILPSSNWVPIGKSNCVLDVQKSQRNPIFPIVVAILKNTNFFRAFIASFMIPAIDIQQDALDITPTNDNNLFVAPPSSDTTSTLWDTQVKLLDKTDQDILWCRFCEVLITALTLAMLKGFGKSLFNPYKPFSLTRRILLQLLVEKKKTTHMLIPSIRFTKLIIHHLKTKYNMHLRSGSPLHYLHDESVLNTLRYVGKDGKEIFGMPIPGALLTDEIKGAPYYDEYQEHVAKYQQYLDAEHGKAAEGGTTESSKATRVTKPKAAKATKPASDPKPKPTSTQPPKVVPEKKQKLVQETPDEPSLAKRSKGGRVRKIRKPMSSLKLVDEPSVEDVPVEEPAYNEEEANLQRALELSLKE
nr:hypothetical protein [Tanacetum cinerariifolium]